MTKTYRITYSKDRALRYGKGWTVFEVQPSHDPELFTEVLIGISAHATEAEAITAKAALEA